MDFDGPLHSPCLPISLPPLRWLYIPAGFAIRLDPAGFYPPRIHQSLRWEQYVVSSREQQKERRSCKKSAARWAIWEILLTSEKRTSISRSELELKHCSVFDSFIDGWFGIRKRKRIHERNLDDIDEFLEWKELLKRTEEQANSNPSWFWGRKDTKS